MRNCFRVRPSALIAVVTALVAPIREPPQLLGEVAGLQLRRGGQLSRPYATLVEEDVHEQDGRNVDAVEQDGRVRVGVNQAVEQDGRVRVQLTVGNKSDADENPAGPSTSAASSESSAAGSGTAPAPLALAGAGARGVVGCTVDCRRADAGRADAGRGASGAVGCRWPDIAALEGRLAAGAAAANVAGAGAAPAEIVMMPRPPPPPPAAAAAAAAAALSGTIDALLRGVDEAALRT